MASIDLPDVNLWIALSAPDHAHHSRAERYWREEASPRLAFCAVTMLGLVRILSNAPVSAGRALDPAQAWSVFRGWTARNEVVQLGEPDTLHDALDGVVRAGGVTPKTWTDAYLAAFGSAAGARLVSFDADFLKFPGLDLLHLAP